MQHLLAEKRVHRVRVNDCIQHVQLAACGSHAFSLHTCNSLAALEVYTLSLMKMKVFQDMTSPQFLIGY